MSFSQRDLSKWRWLRYQWQQGQRVTKRHWLRLKSWYLMFLWGGWKRWQGTCRTPSSPATYGDTEKTRLFPGHTLRLCTHREAGVEYCFSEVEIVGENVDSNPVPFPWLSHLAGFITFGTSTHFTLSISLHQRILVKMTSWLPWHLESKIALAERAQEKSLGENNL